MPDLDPIETFPADLPLEDPEFRRLLNTVAGWAHAVSNFDAPQFEHEVGVAGITLGEPINSEKVEKDPIRVEVTSVTATGDGRIDVKRLDPDGVVTGSEFEVGPAPHISDVTDYQVGDQLVAVPLKHVHDTRNVQWIDVSYDRLTSVEVVTDVRWDSTNNLLQKKTQTIYVFKTDTESGWTTVEGGTGTTCA